MKFIYSLLLLVLSVFSMHGQVMKPVKWQFSSQKVSDNTYALFSSATIDKPWHLYSQHIADGGPVKTSFTFTPSKEYTLKGDVAEIGNAIKLNEPAFDNMELIYFEGKAVFKQLVKLTGSSANIKGNLEFMTCNDKQCLPPETVPFSFVLGDNSTPSKMVKDTVKAVTVASTNDIKSKDTIASTAKADTSKASLKAGDSDNSLSFNKLKEMDVRKLSLLQIILVGFGYGLLSLLMPCIWPIIPLTVSFFLKQNKDNIAKGRMNAILYGLSILTIFLLLGILVSLFSNQQTLNSWSSSWFFNIVFFIMFMIFGLSFLGYFEITVPSWLVNKSENMSDRGGFGGIFFMAFTLVLVSFSCTLPFIGNLLNIVSTDRSFIKPIVGFASYGFMVGLPFALFAYFPAILHKLPKSGGWMNVIKVTFGLLEIALCFIYLSKVDMAYHWNFLSKEKFLAIWIVISIIMGLYLLGKLRFPHDGDDMSIISMPRILLSILFLTLAIYFTTGFWGNELEFYSGFLPNYSEIRSTGNINNLNAPSINGSSIEDGHTHKYSDKFHAPHGLNLYFDYDEALSAAKKANKPLFIDFTGHSCVNCRKMEKSVWPDAEVLKRFKNDFVMVSLYVDDKLELPEKDQYYSKILDKKIETLGDRNYDLEVGKFKQGAQPYYVITDNDGNALLNPSGSEWDADKYVQYLDKGISLYKKMNMK